MPTPPSHSIDLTPEEYAQVFGGASATGDDDANDGDAEVRIPGVTAVIAQHLNGRAQQRVADYARHLAANGERVGVLEVDAGEIRLACYERSIDPNQSDPEPAGVSEHFDPRALTEALDEMSWDLDRWLLVLPNLRSPEAKSLLKEVDHWSLLSTCDHDGVVSCYRTLKGLANVHRPRMTLALMEAAGESQAGKVHKKLRGVCLQFLGIDLEAEPAVRPTKAVAEHVVAHCRPTRDKAALSDGAQWLLIANFLAKAKAHATDDRAETPGLKTQVEAIEHEAIVAPEPAEIAAAAPTVERAIPMPQSSIPVPPSIGNPQSVTGNPAALSEVLDLPDGADESAVLAAILSGGTGELIECPVRAPMCPAARLAVTRDRSLVILAVATKGLAELRAIVQAYRWTVENRALIGMAVPQLSIDGHRHPRLRLLVDHADLTAEALAPITEGGTVTVQAYRKLRWGGRTGLLLEAA
jgi:hypothetical protein